MNLLKVYDADEAGSSWTNPNWLGRGVYDSTSYDGIMGPTLGSGGSNFNFNDDDDDDDVTVYTGSAAADAFRALTNPSANKMLMNMVIL